MERETDTRNFVRKSLVVARDKSKGERVGLGEIAIKRSGTGIPQELDEDIVSMIAFRLIAADSVIHWEYFKNA